MPTTARDVDAYLTDLIGAMQSIDPSIDVQKGPLAVLLYAAATEGARTEEFSTYLQSLYQLSDPTLIRDEDMYELALNFGKDPNVAKQSTVTVYFFRNTRPEAGETYPVNEGTIVSTSDSRFNFTVIEGTEMNGDLADAYFDAATGHYEIPVICEAVAVGTDYDLPPNTINSIQTVQADFDGCINKDYARQGSDPPDKYGMRDIIWSAMQGVNQDTAGQINSIILDVSPTGVDDFSVVPSTDFLSYRRLGSLSSKFGYDVYMISDSIQETFDRGTANGGETFLPFARKPVLSVVYVAVDGVQVAFSFDADQTEALRGSPSANDRVQLSIALQPGQVWELRYVYYDVVHTVNTVIQGRQKIFASDVLIRLADTVDILIAGETQVFASAEREDIIDDIRTFTEGYLRNPDNPSISYQTFVELLDPLDYQQAVEASVDGLQQFRLTRFARLDRAVLDIEQLAFDGKTEYPVLSVNFAVT